MSNQQTQPRDASQASETPSEQASQKTTEAKLEQLTDEVAELKELLVTAGGNLPVVVEMKSLAEEYGELPADKVDFVKEFAISFEGPQAKNFRQPIVCEEFSGSGAVGRVFKHIGLNGPRHIARADYLGDEFAVVGKDGLSITVRAKNAKAAARAIGQNQKMPGVKVQKV